MPRPTMLPPTGYAYPPLPQGYPMRYQQHQQQHGCPPPAQFQNPHPEKEVASYPPQRQHAPPFNNATSSKHEVLVDQLIIDAERKAKHQAMPPPLPTRQGKAAAVKAKKKSKRKSKDLDDGPNKKPPRPYTEYNIFFQLERERIIMDLEKSNRAKEQGFSANEEEEEGETLSDRPSDPHDVLPRPPRFAHLKLLPKWYDSTHRLAENKKNKEKRKHRKTHGLVSFLDLTRRIAKEWSEASDDVKAYCRRVSQRQLGYYKEELKVWKKTQDSLEANEKKEEINDKIHSHFESARAASTEPIKRLPLTKDSKASAPPLPQVIHRFMPPPPAKQRYRPRNMQWQSRHNYPAMPALSPSMDYPDDYRYNSMPGSNMHPLDELMHRRMMYGPQSAMMQPSTRVKKRQEDGGTLENGMPPLESKAIKEEAISPSEDIKETNSFLSPEDTGSPADINAAITPSPSSRSLGPQEHLPMKKRRKKSDSSPGSLGDASPGNNDIISPGDAKLSPFNFSPSEGMVMTPNGEAMIGQMMNESPFPYIDCYSSQEGNGLYDTSNRPIAGYLASPYMPLGSWHPSSAPMSYQHPYDTNMPLATNPVDSVEDSGDIDLDDEEVQLVRKLQATRAKKLMRKHQLMQQQHSWAMAVQSPGVLTHNYSFASPVEKTAAVEEKK